MFEKESAKIKRYLNKYTYLKDKIDVFEHDMADIRISATNWQGIGTRIGNSSDASDPTCGQVVVAHSMPKHLCTDKRWCDLIDQAYDYMALKSPNIARLMEIQYGLNGFDNSYFKKYTYDGLAGYLSVSTTTISVWQNKFIKFVLFLAIKNGMVN